MSSLNSQNSDQNMEQLLFEGLNEHGFLFQEKCAEVLKKNEKITEWRVQTEEYPVSANVKDTRVDIVLRDTSTDGGNHQLYAIVECKRVNPTLGYWLFGNPLGTYSQPLLINLKAGDSKSGNYSINYAQLSCSFDGVAAYLIDNWWLEIGKKGSKRYSSPNPIEDAFIQACIGVSGIVQELELQCKKDPQKLSTLFIPVVITTAPLYVAVYDLRDVDLVSGNINRDKVYFGPRGQKPEKKKWLLIDYGASRSISPERLDEHIQGISPVELEEYHKRSIFVVNSESIVEFFAGLHLV